MKGGRIASFIRLSAHPCLIGGEAADFALFRAGRPSSGKIGDEAARARPPVAPGPSVDLRYELLGQRRGVRIAQFAFACVRNEPVRPEDVLGHAGEEVHRRTFDSRSQFDGGRHAGTVTITEDRHPMLAIIGFPDMDLSSGRLDAEETIAQPFIEALGVVVPLLVQNSFQAITSFLSSVAG